VQLASTGQELLANRTFADEDKPGNLQLLTCLDHTFDPSVLLALPAFARLLQALSFARPSRRPSPARRPSRGRHRLPRAASARFPRALPHAFPAPLHDGPAHSCHLRKFVRYLPTERKHVHDRLDRLDTIAVKR